MEGFHKETLAVLLEIMEKIGVLQRNKNIYQVSLDIQKFISNLWYDSIIKGADKYFGVSRHIKIQGDRAFFI